MWEQSPARFREQRLSDKNTGPTGGAQLQAPAPRRHGLRLVASVPGESWTSPPARTAGEPGHRRRVERGPRHGVRRPGQEARAAAALQQLTRPLGGAVWAFMKP